LAGVLFFNNAFATVIAQQTETGATIYFFRYDAPTQILSQSFTLSSSADLGSIETKLVRSMNNVMTGTVQLLIQDNFQADTICTSTNTIDANDISTDFSTPTFTIHTFNFSSCSLNSGNEYWFTFDASISVPNSNFLFSASDFNTPFTDGYLCRTDTYPSCFSYPPGYDAYFVMNDATPPITPLEITYPADTQILTSGYVAVSGTCNSLETNNRRDIYIQATNTTTGDIINGNNSEFCQDNDTFDVDIPEITFLLYDGDWELTAVACGEVPFACTPETTPITITITDPNAPIAPPPVTPCEGTNLIEDIGCAITNKLQDILKYLFLPSQTAFNGFTQIKTSIENKPPFGYFTSVNTALNDLEIGTPDLVLAGIASLGVIFNPIRTIMTSILWILFAIWLIHRVRSIET